MNHVWLLNECTLVLQTQSKANKPDQGYMAGALAGLSSALAQCKVHITCLNIIPLHTPTIFCLDLPLHTGYGMH